MFDSVRRLFRHLVVYGSADAAMLAVNILLFPIFTRILTPAEYGVLALLQVFEAFLKIVYRWGFDTSFLRLHYDCTSDDQRRRLAGTAGLFLAVANGALLLGLWVAAPTVTRWLDLGDYLLALRLVAANLFVAGFLFLPLTQYRIDERSQTVAGWTAIRALATIAGRLLLVVGLRWGVTGFVLADLIVSAVLFLGLWPTLRRMAGWRFSRSTARELLALGLPHVPHGLLHQVMGMGDRFFLGLYLPLDRLGVYQIASSVASLLKLYPVALTTAWTPLAFDAMRRPDAQRIYAGTATYAYTVLAGLAAAVVVLADPLLRLLTPPEFHAASALVPVLIVGVAIQAAASFISTGLHIAKRNRAFPIITLIAAVAGVTANVVLIPRWGVFGAAAAAVTGQTVLFVVTAVLVHRAYPIPYEIGRLLRITAAAAVVGAAGLVARASLSSWAADLTGGLLLAAFPGLLLVIGVFRATELASLRAWIRSRLGREL